MASFSAIYSIGTPYILNKSKACALLLLSTVIQNQPTKCFSQTRPTCFISLPTHDPSHLVAKQLCWLNVAFQQQQLSQRLISEKHGGITEDRTSHVASSLLVQMEGWSVLIMLLGDFLGS